MKNKKIYLAIIISFIMGIAISITSSYVLAQTLINSEDVYYDKTSSGLAVNNVQAAIDGTCTKFNNQLTTLQTTIINKIYPVGSIYISYNSTNPSSFLGGIWENYGSGRVLKGISSGTAGTTGGSNTVTLTAENLPSHRHAIPSLQGTAKEAGLHAHGLTGYTLAWGGVLGGVKFRAQGTGFIYPVQDSTEGNYLSTTGTSTNNSGNHTHEVTTTASNTEYTGSNTSFSVENSYITVYIWKRTK